MIDDEVLVDIGSIPPEVDTTKIDNDN